MRKFVPVLGMFLLVLIPGNIAVAQQSWMNSAQKTIADLEMHWLQHLDDPAVLQTILADDFVHALPSGFINKQQHIDYVKAHPRSPQENRSFENLKIRVYGDTGIANGIVVISGPGGTHRNVFTDVFVKRGGHWRAVNAQENPEQPQH